MPPETQTTLCAPVFFQGVGVHSGQPCSIGFHPAPADTGIVFRRVDLPGAPEIPARLGSVLHAELDRRTTLARGDARVHTVEHAMSALYAMRVCNAIVELDAAEPPCLDGSALAYAQAIAQTGLDEQPGSGDPVVITRPLAFESGGAEFSLVPSDTFRVTFFFSSDQPLLRSQSASFEITPTSYLEQIAPARTFCFFEELEHLRAKGLIRGGSLLSAVVIGRKATLNNDLRFPDEPVRHKILDFVGDLALLGKPIYGHFLVWRGGHRVNAAFGEFLRKELGF